MVIETDKPVQGLEKSVYQLTESGKRADQYNRTTQAIGEYVGKTYGHEMKILVLQLEETEPEEPVYPREANQVKKMFSGLTWTTTGCL